MPLPKQPSANTVLIENIAVGMPFLRIGAPATMFTVLRNKVIREAGFDFLSIFGDMMRARNFKTNKPGAANKSRHKCGDAFDYNQGDKRLALVKEPRNDRMYWRTYLLCPKQDGSQGESLEISKERVLPPAPGSKHKFFYDFTTVAEALGWHRIRAQQGFEKVSTKKEFWHYQLTEGYTFDEAIELLYGDRANVKTQPEFPTLKTGDHDNDQEVNVRRDVRQLQAQLYLLKVLAPLAEVDGGYGPKTEAAVKAFQEKSGLPVTGIAAEQTRRLLIEKVV
jgi:Putative peptidoglycan binding domain